MPETIISDASCFIVLTNIGELDLLQKLYGNVVTTIEVATEYGRPLPSWVEIHTPIDRYSKQILELQIDKGEASAIALAIETKDSILIVDDYKARKVAISLGLTITGTIGVIVKAKILEIIPSIRPYLEKIRNTNFRLSGEIEKIALREAGEN